MEVIIMINNEEYSYFKKELLKRKSKPYVMGNKELSQELFTQFKTEHPDSSIHFYGTQQYICFDKKARNNLAKMLNEKLQRKEEELQELKNALISIR